MARGLLTLIAMTSPHAGSKRLATGETATSHCWLVCGRAVVIVALAGLLMGAPHSTALAQSSSGLSFRDALTITRQRNERWRAADASVLRGRGGSRRTARAVLADGDRERRVRT